MECKKVSRCSVVSLVWARERVTRCEVRRGRTSGGRGARLVWLRLS